MKRWINGWMAAGLVSASLCFVGCETTGDDAAKAAGETGKAMADQAVDAAAAMTGFEVLDIDGKRWVFRKGSDELKAVKAGEAPSDKHATKMYNVNGTVYTFKAPDMETIKEYLATLSN